MELALLERGMAAQLRALRDAQAAGMRRVGWKIGLNFPEAQSHLGIAHAAVGWLDGRQLHETGARLPVRSGARYHVEAEICLRITGPTGGEVGAATAPVVASIAPALELVDYAQSWDGIDDILSHSMFHEATLLGRPFKSPCPRDLGSLWPRLRVNGKVVRQPRGDLVPGDVQELVTFASDFLSHFGEALLAGDLLLSGSFTDPVSVAPGDEILAEFGACGSATVILTG